MFVKPKINYLVGTTDTEDQRLLLALVSFTALVKTKKSKTLPSTVTFGTAVLIPLFELKYISITLLYFTNIYFVQWLILIALDYVSRNDILIIFSKSESIIVPLEKMLMLKLIVANLYKTNIVQDKCTQDCQNTESNDNASLIRLSIYNFSVYN